MAAPNKDTKKTEPKSKAKASAPAVREKNIAKPTDADALRKKMRAASQLAAANSNALLTFNYLSICQSNTKAKKKAFPDTFIKELKDGEFFLQSQKLVLGEEVDFVPLAFFQIYQEYQTDPQVNKDAKMVGIWLVEDAEQCETQYGKQWNRETPDGHILCPAWWIFGYLPDHPEQERVVLTFKSTGNKIARSWFKDASKRAPNATYSLLYTLIGEDEVRGANSWTKIVPTYKSNVFTLDSEGEIDEILEDYAEKVIDLSGAYNKAFAEHKLVQKHTVRDASPSPRHADRDAEDDGYEGDDGGEGDEGDENPNF